jgi:hypothetical protein
MPDERESQVTEPIPGDESRDDFGVEDERWAAPRQRRDWMWLALMIVIYCAWTLIVYFLEPGLR